MTNVYQVTLDDGTRYDVTTEHHHGNYPETTFAQHLLQIIREAILGIVSGVVVGFVHKGRK